MVVCNVYSDWSTQPWDFESVRLRCHKIKHSSTIVIEATPVDYDDWHFIRIAHLSSLSINQSVLELMGDSEKDWLIGPFAACPMQQRGCVATFTNLRIGPKVDTMHSSDSSSMVK